MNGRVYKNWLAPWRYDLKLSPSSWAGDFSAGLVVTLMLIPQSLAYALLAGLPAHLGLYASVLPLLGYALFGRSPALAVGPVAIASVMTFNALQSFASPASPEWIAGAIFLALASGAILFLAGLLRLGFLAALLSHPVMSGFISGASVVIILGQLQTLLGVSLQGGSVAIQASSLLQSLDSVHLPTLGVGLVSVALLLLARRYASRTFTWFGLRGLLHELLTKASPLLVIGFMALSLWVLELSGQVATVGAVPSGLPGLSFALPYASGMTALLGSALLIALVGFVESVSMARNIGRRCAVATDPNAELRGLGAANILSGASGAFPVTGGLSRSVVNLEAGARTPMAGVISAAFMIIVLLGFADMLSSIPLASLAALIVISVASLFDGRVFLDALRFDRADALGWLATFSGVLVFGVEQGIAIGVTLSVANVLWRQSRPHMAVIGRLSGTEHFRNVQRHKVETLKNAVFVRVDANLFFGNWDYIADFLEGQARTLTSGGVLVLNLSSVSDIDTTAIEGLEALSEKLKSEGARLVFAELKGPITDKLLRSHFFKESTVYLSCHQAFEALRQPS
ncbi:MAG: SulP family inorganic anion transporter [Burkholderiaceae bacterium]